VKLGIPLLIIGLLMLFASIPFSILMIVKGISDLTGGLITGGILSWSPLAGVIIGLMLTTIGATRTFKD
jgi:hypothetical protein